MKKYFTKFAVALAAIITIGSATFVSCNKEDSSSSINEISSSKSSLEIPHFNSREEVEAAIDAAVSFDTIIDLIDFEQKQGRSSIGAISDMFYENININSFLKEADALAFFQDHKDLLDTIIENNELLIMPKWSNTPYRYVANADGMFAVSNRYYRLFKTGTVSTTENNRDKLVSITDEDLTKLDRSNAIIDWI